MTRLLTLLPIFACVMGCAAPSEETETAGSELVTIDEVGSIENGGERAVATGRNKALRFRASHTDVVKATVKLSNGGNAEAFVLNLSKDNHLADDDGSSPAGQAKVRFPVKRNSGVLPDKKEFFIVFNDTTDAPQTATVRVTTCNAAPSGPDHESWRIYQPMGFNCQSDYPCPADKPLRFFNECGSTCGCAREPD